MTVEHIVQQYGYLAVFLLVAGESLGIPLPGELTLLAAAVYAGTGHLRVELVIGTAAVATIVGGEAGYLLGRTLGRGAIERFGRYVLLDRDKLDRVEGFFERYGVRAVFLARFITVLRTFGAVLAGINRMPHARFTLANLAGGIVWSVLYGLVAFLFGKTIFEEITKLIGVGALVVLVLAAVVLVLLHRRRAQSRAG